MDLTSIAIISIVTTILLYVFFLILGVGGISENRRAQGLDKSSKSDNKWTKKT